MHPAFRLQGAVEKNDGSRAVFSRSYGCPVYADITSALLELDPDVVVVATPTDAHVADITEILRVRAPRVILCEKPLAYAAEHAREIVEACARWGVIEVQARLEAGRIQRPVKGVAWYSKGFIHNGSHLFNLLEYWLGEVESWVVQDRGRELPHGDSEPDVCVNFVGGKVLFLAAREEDFSHYTIELVSAQGRLRYEQGGHLITWQPASPDPTLGGYVRLSEPGEKICSNMGRYQWHVAEQLARKLDGQKAYLCSGTQALRTLENMKRILEWT
jgi:predicted dehydrogenase